MRKFAEGDRVEAIVDFPEFNHRIPIGSVGTVLGYYRGGASVYVCWDREVGGHSCDGRCKVGYGWNVREDHIALLCEDSTKEILPENLPTETELLGLLYRGNETEL